MDIYRSDVDRQDHILARYYVRSRTTLWKAAYDIAVGQSIGNPMIRNHWETQEMYDRHCCKIVAPSKRELEETTSGEVCIAYPKENIDFGEDGISQLLCFVMGGHLDIEEIESCQLLDIDLSSVSLFSPQYGISGIRDYVGIYDRPLLGGIVKPKTGLSPSQLLSVVQEMVDGGVNFIKEDEILGNPACCPFKERLALLQPYLNRQKVVYCYCINSDYPFCVQRARQVADAGGNGVHINVWGGLGMYRTIRELDLPVAIHFQKSGDRAFTSPHHDHHISWNVICKLAGLMGVDTIHAGMWGGYSSYTETELAECLNVLRSANVLPALSCGLHPGIVNKITSLFGNDYIANVGGAIHGHPGGTLAGVKAMRQAIDGNFGPEYEAAIKKWGLVT